jgi:hypothetical protein
MQETFVSVYGVIFRYRKAHGLTKRNRLADFLIYTGNMLGRFNRLLWPLFGRKGYKEIWRKR